MATAACFCCPSLEGFPISGGAAGAATGCCSFRFANEKLGQVSRKLLKDMFSNLALPAWARYSALTGSPALSQEPGMSLHGAGEVTRKVGLGASTQDTDLAVPHGVHHI